MGLLLGLVMLFQPMAADNFQRANAAFTTPWVVQTSYAANFIVSSNTATVSSLGSDSAYNYQGGISWPADQWASATLLNPGSNSGSADGFGVTVRASTSAQTFYRFTCNTTSSRVSVLVSGSPTTLSSNPTTCVSGDIIMLAARGTTLTAYKNWVSVFSVTDTSIATGNPGIFYFSTDTGGAVSEWVGGTFAGSAASPPPPAGGSVWPQAASYAISARAGTGSYNNPLQVSYMEHLNTVVVGPFDGWESFGVTYNGTANGSMHAYTQAVQAGSFQPGGTIVLSDHDPIVLNPNVAATNMVAAKMDLLTTYPGGSHVLNGSNHIGNPVTSGPQPTCCGARPPANYNVDYAFDYLANGGALGLAGNPVSTNPTLDGWYLDDTSPYVRYAGDWLRNGTTQGTDNTGTTPASLAFKSGLGTMMARLKTDKAGALVFANLGDLYIQPLSLTNYPQFDGGNSEHAIGWANSADVTGTWFDMMNIVARQKGSLKTGGVLLFGHDNLLNGGADFYRTGAGQGWRYGLASAMLAGAQWAPNPAGPQPNTTPSNTIGDYAANDFGSWLWPDEMSVDPTTLVAYGYSDPNIGLGMGWAGTEIDTGIVVAVWQNGCVRKRYQMAVGTRQLWVILNPSKTTGCTVTYGQRMQAFTGTQVPAVNSGNNNITSETIPAADARFRITFP